MKQRIEVFAILVLGAILIAVLFFPVQVNHRVGFTLIPGGYACGPGFTSCSFGSQSGDAPVPVIVKPGTPDGSFPGATTTIQGGNAPSNSAAPEPGGDVNIDVGSSSFDAGNGNMNIGKNANRVSLGSDAGEVDIWGKLVCNAGQSGCAAAVALDWVRQDPPDTYARPTCEWSAFGGTGTPQVNTCAGSYWSTTATGSTTTWVLSDGGVGSYYVNLTTTSGGVTSSVGVSNSDPTSGGQGISISNLSHEAWVREGDPLNAAQVVWQGMLVSKHLETTCVSFVSQNHPGTCSTPVSYVGFRCSVNGGDGGVPDVTWAACSGTSTPDGGGPTDSCIDTMVAQGCNTDGGVQDMAFGEYCHPLGTSCDYYLCYNLQCQIVVAGKTTTLPDRATKMGFEEVTLAGSNSGTLVQNIYHIITRWQ